MGIILEGKCPGCGYQPQLALGGGRMDCRPDWILTAMGRDPEPFMALGEKARFRVEHQPAVCRNCRKLLVETRFIYWLKDGADRLVADACPDCGGALDPVELKKGRVPCPVCGRMIRMREAGLWD